MLELEERLNILRSTGLFTHVSDEILTLIHDQMESLTLPAGTTLFREGESGDTLYLVVEGLLEICSNGVQIAMRGPGECVGELALLNGTPRSATAKAKTDVLVLQLYRDDFYQALTASWEVVEGVFGILGKKLREDIERQIALTHQQEQYQHELIRAREIQTAMLPSKDLILDWIHLTGRSEPAAVVGGDYYDYFHLCDGCVGLAIGDVTGHGFYSSLLVAIVSGTLRLQIGQDPAPASVHAILNPVVQNYHHTRLLMTFGYMVLDPSTQTLTFTNAGHPYPYLYSQREQKWTPLEIPSLPLGARLVSPSTEITTEWESGDRLFLYSDGLTEVQNRCEQPYSSDALECFLDRYASLPPCEMIAVLYEALDVHRQGRLFDDDVTAVVVDFL